MRTDIRTAGLEAMTSAQLDHLAAEAIAKEEAITHLGGADRVRLYVRSLAYSALADRAYTKEQAQDELQSSQATHTSVPALTLGQQEMFQSFEQ